MAHSLVPQTDATQVVDLIYGAIRNPESWPEVVAAIAGCLNADMAMMTSAPLSNASLPIVFHQMDLSAVQGRPLLSHPEFTIRALATKRAPGVFLFDELMPVSERA